MKGEIGKKKEENMWKKKKLGWKEIEIEKLFSKLSVRKKNYKKTSSKKISERNMTGQENTNVCSYFVINIDLWGKKIK